ncbi:MAG: hypothetical protein WCO42_05340 [bacterium]
MSFLAGRTLRWPPCRPVALDGASALPLHSSYCQRAYGAMCLVLFVALGSPCALGSDTSPVVVKGDTCQQVVEKLGEPKGQVRGGRRTTYYYDRGTVDFLTGRVDRAFLITAGEATAKKEQQAKEETAARRQAEADHARMIAAGKAQREEKLADKAFAAKPPSERLAYWSDFQKEYPDTDVSVQIVEATQLIEAGRKDQDRVAELLDMNKRAAEIEARFKQLDADYAASLANWKRTEIDDERSKLTSELAGIKSRLAELLK